MEKKSLIESKCQEAIKSCQKAIKEATYSSTKLQKYLSDESHGHDCIECDLQYWF
jgi:hypothetical protein